MDRIFFIGDVHGCLEELKELLGWLGLDLGGGDRVIFLGDLIGKGPSSVGVINFLGDLAARAEAGGFLNSYTFLMGNHEKHFLSDAGGEHWGGGRAGLGRYGEALLWGKLKPYLEEERFIAVHGGIDHRVALGENNLETLTSLREINGRAWHSYYKGSKPIIYGHWAKQGLCVKENSIGLDTGCVYGGWLSGMELGSRKIYQVRARKRYCEIQRRG